MSQLYNSAGEGLLQWNKAGEPDPEMLARPAATALYERVTQRGPWARLWQALIGGRRPLIDLDDVAQGLTVVGRHYAGERDVPIAQIRGSEARTSDFDGRWRPLRRHNRHRWLSVALAWELGIALPPVELIQVGDIYFVRDGHHRISVGAANKLTHVRAKVTVWEVEGALPWEAAAPAPRFMLRAAS